MLINKSIYRISSVLLAAVFLLAFASPVSAARPVSLPGSSPISIAFGQTLSGSITGSGQIDSYTFSANAGDNVFVRMVSSTGTLASKIRVYDPVTRQLCETFSSAPAVAELEGCRLTSTDTYTILAFDSVGTGIGDYYLYLQRLNNPGSAAAIDFGQTNSGSIATTAQINTYTFIGSAGDNVLVRLTKAAGTLVPEARVFGPDGTRVCAQNDTTTVGIANCSLSASGAYTILASDYLNNGTRTGDYYLFLQRMNNPVNATSITLGQTLAGSTSLPGQLNTYTFSASAGSIVMVRMTKSSGNIRPWIRVYDPSGTKLCEVYDSTGEISSCSLTSTGAYTILAYDGWDGTCTGSYSLYLQWLNSPYVTKSFQSLSAQDGWLLESSEISSRGGTLNGITSTLYVGDSKTRRQYRGMLSFKTGVGIPAKAIITAVTLNVKMQAILGGGDPLTSFNGLMLDVKKGFFGTSAALQAGDFQAAASKSYGPFNPASSSNWYSINLTSASAYINRSTAASGLTQIRLRFRLDDNNNAVANLLSLYSGNAPVSYRPQLVITYYVP